MIKIKKTLNEKGYKFEMEDQNFYIYLNSKNEYILVVLDIFKNLFGSNEIVLKVTRGWEYDSPITY